MWWSRSCPAPNFHMLYAYAVIYPRYMILTWCLQIRQNLSNHDLGQSDQPKHMFWPPTPETDQAASMPLLIFLQFLLHPELSVLYQIQQGTLLATWMGPAGNSFKTISRQKYLRTMRATVVFWNQGWLMNGRYRPPQPSEAHKTKRSKVLVCYYHTATYTLGHVSRWFKHSITIVSCVGCNHPAVGGQYLEPRILVVVCCCLARMYDWRMMVYELGFVGFFDPYNKFRTKKTSRTKIGLSSSLVICSMHLREEWYCLYRNHRDFEDEQVDEWMVDSPKLWFNGDLIGEQKQLISRICPINLGIVFQGKKCKTSLKQAPRLVVSHYLRSRCYHVCQGGYIYIYVCK